MKWLIPGITLVTMSTAYSSDTVILPEPRLNGDLSVEQAIHKRRSVREFSDKPLTLAEVSQLLWSAQGITNKEKLRSAPSAGALYPLVIYLAVGNIENLDPGVYRYSPEEHQIVRIKKGDSRSDLAIAAVQQLWIQESAVVLVFSAIEERTTWKYGERGIRYIHIEVGHSAQNTFLQAQSLGLGAAVVGAFDDRRLEKLLNLPTGEQVLYLMPVGRPPVE